MPLTLRRLSPPILRRWLYDAGESRLLILKMPTLFFAIDSWRAATLPRVLPPYFATPRCH